MTEHEFLSALREYWLTWLGANAPTATSFWADDEVPGALETTWVRTTIRSEGGARVGVGRQREQTRGVIMVEVYTPRKDGTGPGERLASSLASGWRAYRHSRIQLSAPSVIGPTTDGAFNRHLITLGWRGDMRL